MAKMRICFVLQAVAIASGLFGCATSHRSESLPRPRTDIAAAVPTKASVVSSGPAANGAGPHYDLDTVRISVEHRQPGDEGELVAVAARDLFVDAMDEFKRGEKSVAIARFRSLVQQFPESQFAPIALFNVAAIYDEKRETSNTILALQELVSGYPHTPKGIAGQLFLVGILAQERRYPEALTTVTTLLANPNLSYPELLEAQARHGYVLLELNRLEDARVGLLAAIATWRKIPKLDDQYFVAMAHYYLGEIEHRKFAKMQIRLPDEQLRIDLDAKAAVAARAYDLWREALRFRHAYWATASGYQMSQIFLELWRATVLAPFPTKMNVVARNEYVKEVHHRVRQHLEKALEGHQTNVELAKAYSVETEWSNASKQRAAEIMRILANEGAGIYERPAS